MKFEPMSAATLALAFAFLALGLVVGALSVHFAVLREGIGLDLAVIGTLLTVLACGVLCGMALSPSIMRWIGVARTTLASAVPFAGLLVLATVSGSWLEGAAAFAALGFCMGVFETSINASGSAQEQHSGKRILSRLHALYSVGGLVGGLTTGYGITALSATGHMCVVATLVLLSAVGLWQNGARSDPLQASSKSVYERPSRQLLVLAGAAFLGLFCFSAIRDWSGILLTQSLRLPIEQAGIGFAAFSASTALVRFAGDSIASHVRTGSLIAAGGLVGGLCLTAGIAYGSAGSFIIAMGLFGAAHAILIPVIFSAAGGLAVGTAVSNLATVMAVGFGGYIVGPTVVGWIANSWALSVAFYSVAVASFAIMFILMLRPRD